MPSGENQRLTILQIDGSQGHRFELERAVCRVRPGTFVHSIADGAAAIEHLALCGHRYPVPSLVLLSQLLPGAMDGYELLQKVRALAHLQTLPVILVHSDELAEDVARAHELGASAYLRKPVEKGEYPEFARQILAESWSQAEPSLSRGRLALGQGALGSAPAMAFPSTLASFVDPGSADQSLLDKVLGFVERCKAEARQTIDPFYLAFSEACRRHHLTPAQAMQGGGSQPMIACRREVMIDLIAEGWPDETIVQVMYRSRSEMKRLHKAAREKVGPNLGLCSR